MLAQPKPMHAYNNKQKAGYHFGKNRAAVIEINRKPIIKTNTDITNNDTENQRFGNDENCCKAVIPNKNPNAAARMFQSFPKKWIMV